VAGSPAFFFGAGPIALLSPVLSTGGSHTPAYSHFRDRRAGRKDRRDTSGALSGKILDIFYTQFILYLFLLYHH
jgi:hypothetical protein